VKSKIHSKKKNYFTSCTSHVIIKSFLWVSVLEHGNFVFVKGVLIVCFDCYMQNALELKSK
jgi:hypothetical protein